LSDHARIQVESIDRVGTEDPQDKLGSNPAPAPKFKGSPSIHRAAHTTQPLGFDVSLDRDTNGVVHERVFEAV
jgi:hypothetical protein